MKYSMTLHHVIVYLKPRCTKTNIVSGYQSSSLTHVEGRVGEFSMNEICRKRKGRVTDFYSHGPW